MIRCAAEASAALALLLALAGTARADCIDGSEPGATVEEGRVRGLPPGTVAWRVSRAPAGGMHMATSVALRWIEPGGTARSQVLFAELQDGRPVLSHHRGVLRLRVTYCPAGGACRHTTLAYAWDPAARRFAGADAAARQALAEACADAADR